MPERPPEPRSHRGGVLVTMCALIAVVAFLSVVRILDNEFGPAGAVAGGAAVGLVLCLVTSWAARRKR